MIYPQSFVGSFYKIEQLMNKQFYKGQDSLNLFQTRIFLVPKQLIIYRQAYDINNLLSDLGGVVRVLISIFGVLFYPITQYLFIINAARKLFLARTSNSNIFRKNQDSKDRKSMRKQFQESDENFDASNINSSN